MPFARRGPPDSAGAEARVRSARLPAGERGDLGPELQRDGGAQRRRAREGGQEAHGEGAGDGLLHRQRHLTFAWTSRRARWSLSHKHVIAEACNTTAATSRPYVPINMPLLTSLLPLPSCSHATYGDLLLGALGLPWPAACSLHVDVDFVNAWMMD